METKFKKFYCKRLKVDVYINPDFVTSIQEDNGFGGQTQIEYIGNAGYHTTRIFVVLNIEDVYTRLTSD